MRTDRLLLDTHAFIWWREDSPRLGANARRAITGAALVYVSVATAWEAAIKVSVGKLKLPDTIEAGVHDSGFEQLTITFGHTEIVARLPLHHRDPFDRMLVAQAQLEELTIVTRDPSFSLYDVTTLAA